MIDKKAYLVLKDGKTFEGVGFGASLVKSGEVVFNTSIVGYQEILTDPSYYGQIVVMTYPHIGNYGMNNLDVESQKIYVSGFVVREVARLPSNYRSRGSLQEYLKKNKIPGIAEIDTRELTRHIRDHGAQPAVLAVGGKKTVVQLKKMAAKLPDMVGQNLAKVVSCKKPYVFKKGEEGFVVRGKDVPVSKRTTNNEQRTPRPQVVAYDFGIKRNILRLLNDAGCDVTVVPYSYPAEKILADKSVNGVFLSNGPGDPAPCNEAIDNVKKILGKKPVFGICLGHQILSLALGAATYKLKFGHHGGNQPVKNLMTNQVEITAQNHGFAVDPHTLPKDVEVTHIHLNDETISGIAHKKIPAFSVQYHPEASPGPHDSRYLFESFVQLMNRHES